jgi:hypothetical protein
MYTLLWVRIKDKWVTLMQGSTEDVLKGISWLALHHPHTSYKTQQVNDMTLLQQHFITREI